jgi:hypothetical protein
MLLLKGALQKKSKEITHPWVHLLVRMRELGDLPSSLFPNQPISLRTPSEGQTGILPWLGPKAHLHLVI